MTSPSDHEDCSKQGPRKKAASVCPVKWRAAMALMALVALTAGCGAPTAPLSPAPGRTRPSARRPRRTRQARSWPQMVAYAAACAATASLTSPTPRPTLAAALGSRSMPGRAAIWTTAALGSKRPTRRAARSCRPGGRLQRYPPTSLQRRSSGRSACAPMAFRVSPTPMLRARSTAAGSTTALRRSKPPPKPAMRWNQRGR